MAGNEELTQSRRGRRFLLIGLATIGLVVAAVVIVRIAFPGLPQISEADVDAAERRWEAAVMKNYDIAIRIAGRQPGELRCRVRDGRAVGLSRNGTEMKDERTWHPWSVPGMFETLRIEFDNAKNPAVPYGSPDAKVVLRAEFDPQYGFPRRYFRQVFGSSNDDLTWDVFEFTPK